MKKKILTIFIIIIIIFAVIIFLRNHNNKEVKNEKEIAEVVLENYGGLPEYWAYNIIGDENIVKITQKEENLDEPDVAGAHYLIHYTFEGLKPGKIIVKFNYLDFSENDNLEKAEIYEIIVYENLDVQIIPLYTIDASDYDFDENGERIACLKVTLNTYNESICKCEYSIDDNSFMVLNDYTEKKLDEETKQENFAYLLLNEGKTTIKFDFVYAIDDEKTESSEILYNIEVNNKKRITIIENVSA